MRHSYSLFLAIAIFCSTHQPARCQWVPTGGGPNRPLGVDVMSLCRIDRNIFAGSDYGGVFLLADTGDTWVTCSSGIVGTTGRIYAVAAIETTLFVATNEDGIQSTSDFGTTWTAINQGLPVASNTLFEPVLSLLTVDSTVFAGTVRHGVFRRRMQDTTWSPCYLPPFNNDDVHSLVVVDSTLYAGTWQHGVFRSTDSGDHWSPVNTGLPDPQILALAVSGTNIYAGTYGHGVCFSSNSGATWTAVNAGLVDTIVGSLAISGNTVFAGTFTGVYVSTDNGSHWKADVAGMTVPYIYSLAVIGNELFAGTPGGVWKRPVSEFVTGFQDEQGMLPTSTQTLATSPNPARSVLNVLYQPAHSSATVELWNSIGERVRHAPSRVSGITPFEIGSLQNGIYFARVVDGGRVSWAMSVIIH